MMSFSHVKKLAGSKVVSAAIIAFTALASAAIASECQELLENNFDHVEAFSNIDNWNPLEDESNFLSPGAALADKDGGPSLIQHYSNDYLIFGISNKSGDFHIDENVQFSSGATSSLLRFHNENGIEYVQVDRLSGPKSVTIGDQITGLGSGASAEVQHIPNLTGSLEKGIGVGIGGSALTINYNNFSGGIDGFGPSRLSFYFGEEGDPNSGHKKAHVLLVVKFDESFFAYVDGSEDFEYVGTTKFAHLSSGFTSSGQWGTDAENALVETPQNSREYGLNAAIFNIGGGGLTFADRLFLESTHLLQRHWKMVSGGKSHLEA